MFMKGFTDIQRKRLTIATYLMISKGLISPACLSQILNEHLVKEGISLTFAHTFFSTWIKEKDFNSLLSNLKKAEIDGKLMVRFMFQCIVLTSPVTVIVITSLERQVEN